MLPHKTKTDDQYGLLPNFINLINKNHPLLRLGQEIPWEEIEADFAKLYSDKGRKGKPIRLLAGLLLLKQMFNVSDEHLIEYWCENPYWQAFCGMLQFQWKRPCDSTELVYFRRRIGEAGCNKILNISVKIHGQSALEDEVILDTTVQLKNITFPTDTKLHLKVIWRCIRIAKDENIQLRRSYKTELKQLIRDARFDKSKDGSEKAKIAKERIKAIACSLIKEVSKKLHKNNNNKHDDDFDLYKKIVNQKKDDNNKIYSLHEPETKCIKKGKAHVEYEFGSKVSVAITSKSCLIVGAINFSDNCHDSKTLKPMIDQIKIMTGKIPSYIIADRGYRGYTNYEGVNIILPHKPKSDISTYERRKAQQKCKRRSAIEAIIGHLKYDFRLCRNFLKGTVGDSINLILSAAAFNFRKWMKNWAARPFLDVFLFCSSYHVEL